MSDNEEAPHFWQLDAPTLTATIDGEAPVTLTDLGDCRYSVVNDNSHGIRDEDPVEGPSRVFAFKSADGHLSMYVMYSTRRGIIVLSKPIPLALPAVGEGARFRDFTFGSDGFLTTPAADVTTTIDAVDVAAGTYTRRRASDARIDTFTINTPQPGLRARAANACTIGGASVGCAGLISMPLPGTGIGVYISVAPQNFFGITVAKPRGCPRTEVNDPAFADLPARTQASLAKVSVAVAGVHPAQVRDWRLSVSSLPAQPRSLPWADEVAKGARSC